MSLWVNIVILAAAVVLSLYFLKKGVNLGIIMLMDSAAVVVLAKVPLKDALKFTLTGAFSYKTVKLLVILFFIMMLENIMRNSGMIKTMVTSLKQLVGSNRFAAALMPAVIGLLPSPGGARFSCPMVEEVVGENSDNLNKAYTNYWFRHIWMDGFILYPGLILAAELIGTTALNFFAHLLPFIVLTALMGVISGIRRIKKEEIPKANSTPENLRAFFLSVFPVIALIALYMLLLQVTEYSLEIASLLVIIALIIIKKYDFKSIAKIMKEAFPLKYVVIIIGVMVFKEIVLESKVMDNLPGLMKSHGIPVRLLFLLLPFAGGFFSGISIGFISLAFPVLIPLGLGENIWYAVAAFAAGFAGNMITPLHLCAVMSSEYFHAKLGKLLLKVALAQVALILLLCVLVLAIMI